MTLDVAKFLFDTPLYTPIIIDKENETKELNKLCKGSSIIEGYNPRMKKNSTFSVITNFFYHNNTVFLNLDGLREVKLKCKQYDDQFTFFVYYFSQEKKLIKYGQIPSVADFHEHELKKYSTVLSDKSEKELSRAIGLAANGIGIGSYVYLRRIFETLVKDASIKLVADGGITEQEFNSLRMEEKIGELKEYLPTFLVENKQIYSILSRGIHELDEQTCLENFDVLRIGIELILDQALESKAKENKLNDAKKAISKIHANLKN